VRRLVLRCMGGGGVRWVRSGYGERKFNRKKGVRAETRKAEI
jgi:hypothetical protein